MSEVMFDIDGLRESLRKQAWDQSMGEDDWTRQIFVGSVFSLLPSGKYYTPWANSNVEACQSCRESMSNDPCDEENPCTPPEDYDGEEPYHCEVCQDHRWYARAEEELEETGLFLTSGEGDPCDLFIAEAGRPTWGDVLRLPDTWDEIKLEIWDDFATVRDSVKAEQESWQRIGG